MISCGYMQLLYEPLENQPIFPYWCKYCMIRPQIQIIFCGFNTCNINLSFITYYGIKCTYCCFTPKSLYKFYDLPLGIAMGIIAHGVYYSYVSIAQKPLFSLKFYTFNKVIHKVTLFSPYLWASFRLISPLSMVFAK